MGGPKEEMAGREVSYQVSHVKSEEGANDWETGLCDCFDDFSICCYGAFCLPCATASARTNYDGSNWCFNCLCMSPVLVRNIAREGMWNIGGNCLADVLIGCFCAPCSVCQILRESEIKGTVAEAKLARNASNQWSTGLFECTSDTGACCYACICPCCALASARTEYDTSNWLFNLFAFSCGI